MDNTLTNGTFYSLQIQLLGIETWATDTIIQERLHDMGFIDIDITDPKDGSNMRFVVATWNGSTGADATTFPPEIVDVHEI